MLDGLSTGMASIFGFADDPTGGIDWGRPLLIALLVASAARARLGPPLPNRLWVVLAVTLSFWFLLAANTGVGREPDASRYQYVGAILLLLVAAELASGVRPSLTAILLVLSVAGLATIANVSILHVNYLQSASASRTTRGDLAAIEIASDSVDPGLPLFLNALRAGPYLSAVDSYGSPAYDQSELARAPESARVAADTVLGVALRLAVYPTAHPPPAGGRPPRLLSPSTTLEMRSDHCLTVHTASGMMPVVELPPRGAILSAPAGAAVSLRRFATESFPVAMRPFKGPAVLPIPADRSHRPWELQVAGGGRVTVCGRRAG